jgi:tetratricopeptide (TPR) repeat protein
MRLLIAVLLSTFPVAAANVRVWQDTLTLLTWSEGPPDTNPRFELYPQGNYPSYPYAFRTNLLSDNAKVAWRQLNLENEYLFCRVLPDLGGHLYSCRDKINGREMFYANPVIRKGWIGLRGAWVPVGIELNFPVSHSLTTVSPVIFGTQQHPDGSAGVWVADIDRQTGMEWRVEWILRPGSAVLEEQVWLYNRGDSRHPYHFWSTSTETIQDGNSGFQYPMLVSGSHGFTSLDTWPLNQAGVDMSAIRNHTGQVGLFAYGSNEPFFAAYHPATRTGTAHFADPAAVPGKKLWSWGPAEDIYVRTRLTQDFPSYIETQAGVTVNQETRRWLEPQRSSHFAEYWMPVRQLDGVSRANLAGVLYLGRTTIDGQPALVAEFNANATMSGVTVNILNGATKVFTETVGLHPETTYVHNVAHPATGENYTFQIVDPKAGVVFTHTENTLHALPPKDVTLGKQPAPDLSKSDTDQQVLARGASYEQFMQYALAESTYSAGLTLFPQSAALLKAAGRLAVSAARFSDAVGQLTQVPGDAETQYYLGLAYAGLGQQTQAKAAWNGILLSPDFGTAATFQLACLDALTGDLASAATLFDRLNTVRAGALEVAVLRHQGNQAAAGAKVARWQAVSPTDLFLRHEAVLLGRSDAALPGDLSAEPERVLNLVDDYFRLGFWADAASLLSATYPAVAELQRELASVAPQNNALIAYYRGYAKGQQGESPAADFAAASNMPLVYLHPNRLSSFAVLRAALQTNPSDASAHFLLGLLFMSRRQVDNAIAEWQKTRSIRRNIPTLHRNLGRAYLDIKNDVDMALPILKEGLADDANNPDLQDAYKRALQLANSPRTQTITFGKLPNHPLGDAPFTVSATASSGLPVSFNSQTTTVCTVSGSQVTLVSVGTCTIQATQAGNAKYAPAPKVAQSFNVTKATDFGARAPGDRVQ